MFRSCAVALVAAMGFAAPASAITLGLGVEIDPYPLFAAAGPTEWFVATLAEDGFDNTQFTQFFTELPLLRTGPGTVLDTTDVGGAIALSWSPGPDGLSVFGTILAALEYNVIAGLITIPFTAQFAAWITDIEFDLSAPIGPTINFLMETNSASTTELFENLFGDKVFGRITLDVAGIDDVTSIFDPSSDALGQARLFAFFSMYRVKEITDGGGGNGGDGGDDLTPIPLPASVPLLLAGLGAFALVRRRA